MGLGTGWRGRVLDSSGEAGIMIHLKYCLQSQRGVKAGKQRRVAQYAKTDSSSCEGWWDHEDTTDP